MEIWKKTIFKNVRKSDFTKEETLINHQALKKPTNYNL